MKEYNTFIPASLISSKGVIRGLGTEIDEKEVINRVNEEESIEG